MMVRQRMLSLLACCCLAGFLTGCERQPIIVETVLPVSHLRLMKINSAYSNFADRFGRAPRNANELLPFLATENTTEDTMEQVSETLLVASSGHPFVICYEAEPMGDLSWAKSTPVLAYEKTPGTQAGEAKRWVLTLTGAIFQMSETEFREASFPPGHVPVLEHELESEAEGAP